MELWKTCALAIILYNKNFVDGIKCLKNEDIGWREGNIYTCEDPSYPACCEVNRKFTCCEVPRNKNIREQLQLWCTVSVFILALFILYLYFKSDSDSSICCNPFRSCYNVCTECCHGISKRKWKINMQNTHYLKDSPERHQIIPTSNKKLPSSASTSTGIVNPCYNTNGEPFDIA